MLFLHLEYNICKRYFKVKLFMSFTINMKLAKDRGIFTSKSGLQGGIKALIALGFMDKVIILRPVYGMTYGVYRLSDRWWKLTEAEIKKALETIKRSS